MNNLLNNIPSVKPDISFINDMVEKINTGKLRLPLFQRPFIWGKKDVISFLDSIYKGYPIGSVLLWNGGGKKIKYATIIGGKEINLIKENTENPLYIVDGQQRLTSLYCCLNDEFKSDLSWSYYFDLRNEIFVHSTDIKDDLSYYLDLKSLSKTTSFLREANRIMHATNDDKLVEKAEYLSDKIRNYKMATIVLEGGSLDEIVEIFSRLNFMGKSITQAQIVYALTYNEDENNRINKFMNEIQNTFLKRNFLDVSSDFCLQIIKTAINLEIYDNEWTKISLKLKEIERNNSIILDEIISSVESTIYFLQKELKITRVGQFPYITQFFMLFNFFLFKNRKTSNYINKETLKNLFYFISIYGLSSSNPSTMEKTINFFRNGAGKEVLPKHFIDPLENVTLFELNKKFNAGSALGKTLSLMIFDYVTNCGKLPFDPLELNATFKYPPENILPSKLGFSNRLGQKRFISKNSTITLSKENIFLNDILSENFEEKDFETSLQEKEHIMTEFYNFYAFKVREELHDFYKDR